VTKDLLLQFVAMSKNSVFLINEIKILSYSLFELLWKILASHEVINCFHLVFIVLVSGVHVKDDAGDFVETVAIES